MNSVAQEKEDMLKSLRSRIMDAIRFSERYWMIYKETTFGIATIVDLNYKKIYIEVLFFLPDDVSNGKATVKINVPIETQLEFDQIEKNPPVDEEGFVNAKKVIETLNRLIDEEMDFYKGILNKEVDLLCESFENYTLNNNPYHRQIYIHFDNFYFKLNINFENYPVIPRFHFSKYLRQILRVRDLLNTEIIVNWSEQSPPHVVEIVKTLSIMIAKKLKLTRLPQDSQILKLNELSLNKQIKDLSFSVHRGESIGIIYENEQIDKDKEFKNIKTLFEIIRGIQTNFSGEIKIFGNYVQLTPQEILDSIFILTDEINPELKKMSIKKAIEYNVDIPSLWKKGLKMLEKTISVAGLKHSNREQLGLEKKLESAKKGIDRVLEVTGLNNLKKEKLQDLPILEQILFKIAKSLLQSPRIILIQIRTENLDKINVLKFNKYLDKIKSQFHVIFLLHGPREVVSNCDKILTIIGNQVKVGTLESFIANIPFSGEIITIDLEAPEKEDLVKMFKNTAAVFMEEREGERYKLYPLEQPEAVLSHLIETVGEYMNNFTRHTASLVDYLEYIKIKS